MVFQKSMSEFPLDIFSSQRYPQNGQKSKILERLKKYGNFKMEKFGNLITFAYTKKCVYPSI